MTKPKSNTDSAREISDNAQPSPATLVETYFGSRGITLPDPAPECLRFAPKLAHPNERYFPAMVVQLTNPKTGAPTGGIQRTFLDRTGKGKAQVEKSKRKMSLGPCKGGVARQPIEGNRSSWAKALRRS
jgi:hypothetical protein